MNQKTSPRYIKRAFTGVVAAFGIGFVVIVVCNTVWAVVQGFTILDLWGDDSLWQILLISLPFLALALGGVVARLPWIAGLCLTAAFWGFWLFQITRPFKGGGADIGLALLMMFSPVPIIAVCVIAARISAKRQTGEKPDGS